MQKKIPWREVSSPNPYIISHLPLIARLRQIGFRKFKHRWTKRLFKRSSRWLFDFAFHVLDLGGEGEIEFRHNGTSTTLYFNGRSLHFSSIYAFDHKQVFEPQVMGLLEILIRDNEVFFDVGANWGMETLHAATLRFWSGEIHAFEPVLDTYSDLKSLVIQADLQDRVTCHNLALSNLTGHAKMNISDFNSGTAKITNNDNAKIIVDTVRLDELDLPGPTFVKLDVEGYEAQVCDGAKKTISQNKPFIIFETWHTKDDHRASEATFDILQDLGYVFFRPAWRRIDGGLRSIWSDTQPPSYEYQLLTLVPMDSRLRPFMAEHIDVFACHVDRLDDLSTRFIGAG